MPYFSVVQWLTTECKGLDWFGRTLYYVQYKMVFFVFLTFECWVLTTGRLQAVRTCECGCEREEKAQLHLIYVVG
jgi:hypothetical protein